MKSYLHLNRRDFVKKTAVLAGAVGMAGNSLLGSPPEIKKKANPLPKWKGFNLLDFFSPDPNRCRKSSEEDFKWMSDWGFDFVRIPMVYPSYLDIDRTRDITAQEVLIPMRKHLSKWITWSSWRTNTICM
jgi:endoglucanase